MKFLCIIMTLMIAGAVPRVLAQRLIVTNPLDVDRPPQVVEIPLEQVLNRLHLSLDQANSIVAEEYAALKRELARRFPFDREAYTDAKYPFIARALGLSRVDGTG